MFFSAWLTVFAISLIAVVTPGPDLALVLRNSLSYSQRAGIFTAIGISVGNLVHATYSLIGLSAVISKSIFLFSVLKWMGAAYLIYIGVKSLKARRLGVSTDDTESRRDIRQWTAFRIGFLGNLLNPKATLFFLALFTQIVQTSTPMVVQAIYGITVAFLALSWFVGVAVVISQQGFRKSILSFSHWLERLTGTALIVFGLRLAVAEASE